MAKLSDIVGNFLHDIVQARVDADKFSAKISEQYKTDQVLSNFPVPRIEIQKLTIDLKFALVKADTNDVIVDAARLKEIGSELVSTLSLDVQVQNYSWTKMQPGDKNMKLIESS